MNRQRRREKERGGWNCDFVTELSDTPQVKTVRYPTSSRLGSPTGSMDTWKGWKNHPHIPAPKHPWSTVMPQGLKRDIEWNTTTHLKVLVKHFFSPQKSGGKFPPINTEVYNRASWNWDDNALGNPNPGKPNPRRRVCYCLWGITNTVKDNENIKFKETACFPIHMKIIPVPLVMHLGSFVKTSTKMSSKPRKPPAFLW